ncbi:MAG: 16S rRNA (cytidine(1402)-2'-O)-methyltransferase [Zoogloeaceae bacterium]|jgi:16S rRNA (cytidine1402-2'-O)-methyltransferase|nr:16S rRNA (cytidine(1402)-2'-O)-methyltransferase [Zoogloeaceae bacterium]
MPSDFCPPPLAPLYVVPTPLGNLADLSARAREILTSVSWVAAEDTRHSALLLRHIGARPRLFSAHAHNEQKAAEQILKNLAAGEAVALVTDAGTPGISDPGARIVAHVHAAGGRVIPLPGPCAAITALSASGLEATRWFFYGFLPATAGARQKELAALKHWACPIVFYEAPHRVVESATDLALILGGERRLFVARELTKQFESTAVLPLSEAANWFMADPMRQKGEFVLIVTGRNEEEESTESSAAGERALQILLADGLPVRQAARLAAQWSGHDKKSLYKRALLMRKER